MEMALNVGFDGSFDNMQDPKGTVKTVNSTKAYIRNIQGNKEQKGGMEEKEQKKIAELALKY
jgi:hypothetical protein